MSLPILHMQNIEVSKKGKTLIEIDDLSIQQGEIIGVVGPNGAGKSTLVKAMALLEPPARGQIKYRGRTIWPGHLDINLRRQMAVVFQQPLMFDTTVYHNIAVSLRLRKMSKKKIAEKVDYWLKQFGISHLSQRHAKTLSGGEAQRVNLARAMVSDPEILFLDEPFTALDLPTRRSLLRDFKRILMETGTTTVMISHDYQEIKYLCQDIYVMFNGNVVLKTDVEKIETSNLPSPLASFLKDWMTPLG